MPDAIATPPETETETETEGASLLPALAEVHRRAGRLEEAEQVARRGIEFDPEQWSPRVVLALALLDRGRAADARKALEPLGAALLEQHGLETPAPGSPASAWPDPEASVSEDELDEAFAEARPEREQMIDADSIAQRAIRSADLDADDEPEVAPFATQTVADLLEQQGDPEAARHMRRALAARQARGEPGRGEVIRELERWLENLQEARP